MGKRSGRRRMPKCPATGSCPDSEKHRLNLDLFESLDQHPFSFRPQKHFERIVQIANGG